MCLHLQVLDTFFQIEDLESSRHRKYAIQNMIVMSLLEIVIIGPCYRAVQDNDMLRQWV